MAALVSLLEIEELPSKVSLQGNFFSFGFKLFVTFIYTFTRHVIICYCVQF